jgi:integrase
VSTVRLQQAISEYLEERRREDVAAKTLKQYTSTFSQFKEVLAEGGWTNPWMTQVGPSHIRYFFYGKGEYQGKGAEVSGATFNVYRARVTNFFAWCAQQGYLRGDPWGQAKIKEKPVVKRQKVWLTEEETDLVLDAAASPRDRFAIALGLETAGRASECQRIQFRHLDLARGVIDLIITKSRSVHERHVEIPISPWLREELYRWCEWYAGALNMSVTDLMRHDDWYVLPSQQTPPPNRRDPSLPVKVQILPGRPLARFDRIMHRVYDRLGVDRDTMKGQAFHLTRRTAAERMREATKANGGAEDLGVVQAFLRHARRETTEVYLDLSKQQQSLAEILTGGKYRAAATQRPAGGTVTPLRRAGGPRGHSG